MIEFMDEQGAEVVELSALLEEWMRSNGPQLST